MKEASLTRGCASRFSRACRKKNDKPETNELFLSRRSPAHTLIVDALMVH